MPPRPALAVSLYVSGRRCVVVGEGAGADERARRLREAGAEVVRVPAAGYRTEVLSGARMVFVCDATVGEMVSRDARAAGVLCHVHDLPDLSDLAMPALARRGPLQVSIATDGQAPALARRLREEIGRLLDEAGGEVDALVAALSARRDELPPGERGALYDLAKRLHITGKIELE